MTSLSNDVTIHGYPSTDQRPIPPAWITKLSEFARQIVPQEFSGKIELNFLQGGVTGTNVTQSYRK
jgi:hypothetical protein